MALLTTCSGCGESRSTTAGRAANSASSTRSSSTQYLNDGDSETNHDGDQDDESPARDDHDADSSHEYTKIGENRFYHDSDDYQEGPLSMGRPAPALERPVTALIERYLAAAKSIDTTTACSLLLPRVAHLLPSEFGGRYGPAYARGANSCNAILARVFGHYRSELRAPWVVTEVRVVSSSATAMLGSRHSPASSMALGREGGRWGIESMIPIALP